ncbi:MAG: sigma-70 family RNA polymerase sigma factor [Gemmatimonadetes bacterium]|uniref:Sigma-70 family RNA polymerase sigma factor n=1 Tax=Candidatus Kutchimonas denitrificans TaxID=3056748 RepID=A0AAE5CDK6_9BACT|nr:sigma-70 family RNA polymerase sigma factor [Gemmatimonadota bacterium]NIR75974.1 sigma-70 family RNA polymerase sigma factor [Candidatus Kutchimonas denitrificans]NIS02166.1 sigma-70 family RNA polymerase sigma factor [Gemmatimonadota bacterium]NIT67992.1 sigma-70 family RNA polymerase sigma factor [Gemmatimonadota bacterium]NIU54018.1 sigma-70 family RNA polymerase sigma factor [Gemmatimonadota bacterium]
MTKGPADSELAQRTQAGDRDAFELLARRYLRPIHSVVASFLSERAEIEDAAQETFLRALDRIQTFDPDRPFAPWLYQIARNVARNRRKRGRREEPLSDIERSAASGEPAPSARVERDELRRLLAAAIDELPQQRRTAFTLTDIEEYPMTEVARLMGLSAGTVRSHVHHARRALRDRLSPLLENQKRDDE